MRRTLILAILVMGAFLCSAEPDVNETIGATLAKTLDFRANYSVNYFGSNGENYGFVSYNGTELFIVNISSNGTFVVSGKESIDSVLRGRNRWLLSDLVYEVVGDIVAFNQSRDIEAKCEVSLGLDRFPCSDPDSCFYKSCIYSQAMCLPYAEGNGKPFLTAMAAFSKATVALDLDTGELMRGLNAFAERRVVFAPSESVIADMEAQVSSISANALFKPYSEASNGFEFCTPIPYRTDALARAKAKLIQLRTKLASDAELNMSRERIFSETARRLDVIELAQNQNRAILNEIKKNASEVFDSTYAFVKKSSEIIIGESITARVVYLNQSLMRINRTDNLTAAYVEYGALAREAEATKKLVNDDVNEFDELVSLSNDCSAALAVADANITSPDGKVRLSALKSQKDNLDSLMGPPVDETQLGSIRGGLTRLKNEANVLVLEETPVAGAGFDYTMVGGALLAFLVIGAAYWIISKNKAPKKKPAGAKPEGQQEGAKPEPQRKPDNVAAPQVAHYRIRLTMRGGAYRTQLRTVIKDGSGNLAPDGTTVAFKANAGTVTPSATTKNGMAYASMAFKDKPREVAVIVSALGIERAVKISFV